jgi:general secretion pathway protein G
MYTRGLQADAEINPEDTWGKRSYDSDADNPREGSDVYDIYSFSTDIGMNGIAYGQW